MKSNEHTTPVNQRHLHLNDPFWSSFQTLVLDSVIPYEWEALNDRVEGAVKSYCMQNFRIAAGLEEGEFNGPPFIDSDFAKWIEAVGYALLLRPDAALEKTADEAIELVVSVQQPDGYLDTRYIIKDQDKRFTNLKDEHELYCFGHMLEGAISYYQATGKDTLLNALVRFADCIDQYIGAEEGKLHGYPGHEVAEMALMRLYALNHEKKYLNLARYFIDQRGQAPLFFAQETEKNSNRFYWKDSSFQYQYYQAGKPVREQEVAEGHAVRAVYLYSGMADVARVTGDETLVSAVKRLWNSLARQRMYITGSIGSSEYGEAFTFDYDQPNDTAYNETCASVGTIFFARRMLELDPRAEYADVMERVLYNGAISGMSLDGKSFFYVNPLEVVPEACEKDHLRAHVKPTRQKWFGCACCPPNLARLLASLGSYIYTQREDTLYFNLYIGGSAGLELNGNPFRFTVESSLPWQGGVTVTIEQGAQGTLALRIPQWCGGAYTILVNGRPADVTLQNGYAMLTRGWASGDTVKLAFAMPVVIQAANPLVREDIDRIAVTRGPIVYCLEEADNGPQLHRIFLRADETFTEAYRPDLLGGVMTLKTQGEILDTPCAEDCLYRPAAAEQFTPKPLTFIPYYAWANRALGEMLVWVHRKFV